MISESFNRLFVWCNNPYDIQFDQLLEMSWWFHSKFPRDFADETVGETAVSSEFMTSNSEVHKLIKNKGLRWNGSIVTDFKQVPTFVKPGVASIGLGKKRHKLIFDGTVDVDTFFKFLYIEKILCEIRNGSNTVDSC